MQLLPKWVRALIESDENESLPYFAVKLQQTHRLRVKTRRLFHMWRMQKRAVVAISPTMVGAVETLIAASAFQKFGKTVRTGIDKGPHVAVRLPKHHDRGIDNVVGNKVTVMRDIILAPDTDPALIKQTLNLQIEEGRGVIYTAGHRYCLFKGSCGHTAELPQ